MLIYPHPIFAYSPIVFDISPLLLAQARTAPPRLQGSRVTAPSPLSSPLIGRKCRDFQISPTFLDKVYIDGPGSLFARRPNKVSFISLFMFMYNCTCVSYQSNTVKMSVC